MAGLDLGPFVDRMAQHYYESFDSHFPSMTWEQYKLDDSAGAEGLYVEPQRTAVLKALSTLDVYMAATKREAAEKARREEHERLRSAVRVATNVLSLAGFHQ